MAADQDSRRPPRPLRRRMRLRRNQGLPRPRSAPSQASNPALTGVREAAARLKAAAARPAVIAHAPAASVKAFAEILAQRLDNATQFDLRLDPPALGSVEGRLTLGDDGQATLALSFDNQSAFDLFRRDENALRFALADAGFDLAGRNLQFSFREPSRGEDAARVEPKTASVDIAPLHRGVIDIHA